MSDHEFENYLALLSRLLRLGGKQRQRIAQELRAHLEDRLEELLAQGLPREEAVRQALDEFGDAAGLAGQFVAISRNRKQRWLMRLTTFSVAAMLLIAAGIAIFWPGRNAAPGVAAAVGQAPNRREGAKDGTADPFGPPAATAKAAKEGRPTAAMALEEKLNQITDMEFIEQPLKEAVEFLGAQHRIPIVLKHKKLEEAGINPDAPVTKNLHGIRLSSALNLMLEELDLTYLVKDEVLQITTLEDAASRMEIRVYDCRDLLTMPALGQEKVVPDAGVAAPGGGGGFGPGIAGGLAGSGVPVAEHDLWAERLKNLITTNVDSQSWEIRGGAGAISEYNGLIVVTQTSQTHKKVEHVLDMLREAAGLEVPKTGKVVR